MKINDYLDLKLKRVIWDSSIITYQGWIKDKTCICASIFYTPDLPDTTTLRETKFFFITLHCNGRIIDLQEGEIDVNKTPNFRR